MSAFDEGIEITPARAREMLERGEAQLIDVREDHEWDAGRIAFARHIELEQLGSNVETIDRDLPVIFQCRVGARSMLAAKAFVAAGYEAASMAGGIKRWVDEGFAIEPDDGIVADH